MVTASFKGDFKKTEKYLKRLSEISFTKILEKYGKKGVAALRNATPADTGRTADSWGYSIEKNGENLSLVFTNSNIQNGVHVAILIQYGHGTRNGGYVRGTDYVNPALRPIFDEIAREIRREADKL